MKLRKQTILNFLNRELFSKKLILANQYGLSCFLKAKWGYNCIRTSNLAKTLSIAICSHVKNSQASKSHCTYVFKQLYFVRFFQEKP